MKTKKLTLTEAFAGYGAKLKNTRWACSAIANDGSLVISCWNHLFVETGHKRYQDRLSRWGNHLGRNLLAGHLRTAVEYGIPVRLVVARLDDPQERFYGDKSLLPKTFSVETNLVGKVVEFSDDDDGAFAIAFR